MMQVFFTFKTFSDAGIGDQLGAQFAHVFALGSLCGWTYVHLSPIGFNRWNFTTRHSKADDMSSPHNASSLLGLNLTSAPPSVDIKIVANLSTLISDARCVSLVNDRLLEILNKPKTIQINRQESESSVLLEIELDSNYHAFIPTIESLVEMSWTQVLQFSGEAFLQRQCSSISSTPFFSHPCAVAHFRVGDSIRIDTPFCPIILHGREVYTNLSDYRRIVGSVDPGRRPHFNPFDLADRMDSLLIARGFKRESLFVVSDGFKASRACIVAHMRSRRLNLRLAISALNSINRLESMFLRVIRDIPPSRRIIGEDSDSTIKSIKLFSSADFLMCNSGSFSNVMFNLYNPMAQADDAFAWL